MVDGKDKERGGGMGKRGGRRRKTLPLLQDIIGVVGRTCDRDCDDEQQQKNSEGEGARAPMSMRAFHNNDGGVAAHSHWMKGKRGGERGHAPSPAFFGPRSGMQEEGSSRIEKNRSAQTRKVPVCAGVHPRSTVAQRRRQILTCHRFVSDTDGQGHRGAGRAACWRARRVRGPLH